MRSSVGLAYRAFLAFVIMIPACQTGQGGGRSVNDVTSVGKLTSSELTITRGDRGPSVILRSDSFEMRDKRGRVRAELSLREVKGAGLCAGLSLSDGEGKPRLTSTVNYDGTSRVWLLSRDWDYTHGDFPSGFLAQVDTSGNPTVGLHGTHGVPSVELGVDERNEAYVNIYSAKGAAAVSDAVGLVSLRIQNDKGSITIKDSKGRILWSALPEPQKLPASQPTADDESTE
jgi:hypothetical protein